MIRAITTATLIAFLAWTSLFAASSAFAQTANYSGLQNQNLNIQVNPADLLLNLTMGGACKGSLSQVRVTEDTETRLTLSVTAKDFGGCILTATLVAGDRKAIKGFQPAVITVPSGNNPATVELSFDIDRSTYPASQTVTVPLIYFTFAKESNASKYYRASYTLNKRFFISPASADVITEVTMSPLGSAANIPRTATRPATVALPRIRAYEKLSKAPTNLTVVRTKSLYMKGTNAARLNIDRSAAGATTKVDAPRTADSRLTTMSRMARPVRLPTTTTPAQPAPSSPNPQGPGDEYIPLFENLVTDYDFNFPSEISNIQLNVYPDKNKSSGVYYFLPSSYSLQYKEDQGPQFVIDYGTATSGDTGQTVRMSGILTAGIGKKEIDIVKELVRAYVRNNPQMGFPSRCELQAVQIEGSPAVTFDTDLHQYNISNQSVIATSLSEPIEFSWRTNQANATDISTSLKANAGVVGDMILKPKGGALSDQRIRVSIRLADEKTIGRLTLGQGWRTEKWHNISPYPITLKYLHVLWVNGNTPAVYTWNLGDKEIPPRSQVVFHGEAVPQWLDNEPYARFWLDYEIEQCDSCHDSVIRSVIHSTVQSQAQQIKFKLLTFFQEFHLNTMLINVRTRQADPSGGSLQTLPAIEVMKDAQDYLSANIYVPPGGAPEFEYQLQIIQDDGKAYESAWQPGRSLLVPIGSSQIRESFRQLSP